MSTIQTAPPSVLSTHACTRLHQHRITVDELHDAHADSTVPRQADGHLELRGRNGITYITDLTGHIVITVLPRSARPARDPQRNAGVSGYRAQRRGRQSRTERHRPHR